MRIAPNWLSLLLIAGLMLALQTVGPEPFRYDGRLIEQGQYWRWLSGHLVHANWMHLALNLAGFALCIGITGVPWNLWQWCWRIVLLATGISAGFFLWHPQMGWYVGFSGVLYGLYMLAAYATLQRQTLISALLMIFVVAKIALEQWSSVTITSADLIGVPVLVDAHLYGVALALIMIAADVLWRLFFTHSET